MKKELIATIIGITIIGGAGAGITANAESLNSNGAVKTISQIQNENSSVTNENFGIQRYKEIRASLEKGETVSQIKTNMINNLKVELNKKVSDKKLTEKEATNILSKFTTKIEKEDILDGIVKNKEVRQLLNAGQTLNSAKETMLVNKKEEINKEISAKKITAEQGNELISKLEKSINNGTDIFVNYNKRVERLKTIQEKIKKGETVKQIKSDMINDFKVRLQNKVKDNKINQDKADKLLKQYTEHINNANILKGVIKNKTVIDDLNSGKTLTQAKENLIQLKKDKINQLVSDNKITSLQGKDKIAKINKNIENGNDVFINYN